MTCRECGVLPGYPHRAWCGDRGPLAEFFRKGARMQAELDRLLETTPAQSRAGETEGTGGTHGNDHEDRGGAT